MKSQMQWVNALSTKPSLEAAISEVAEQITAALNGSPADVGILFISSAYASDYPRLLPLLLEQIPLKTLIGCGGGGIVGTKSNGQILEIEETAAISLSVGCLPDVRIHSFHVLDSDLPDLDDPPNAWIELLGVSPEEKPHFILLSEPFTTGISNLLEGLDFVYPESVKVGGLSSSGVANCLFYYVSGSRPTIYQEGTIGLVLSGEIILEAVVAQGCRPIGDPYMITKGERNIILELSDQEFGAQSLPPLDALRNLLESLDDQDRQLAQSSLFVGLARDEFQMQLKHGDFLIRNLLGVDPRAGAMAIGDKVRSGQRMQFHLRDSQTSAQDLEYLLQLYRDTHTSQKPALGALMFSCLGRGQGLYEQANFDSSLFSKYFPNIKLGGFFGNGEIGPVAKRTFLHGYTSVFAIVRER
ncbi:MAG: FIST N-terminal domain-containing protein [Cyanobacteriota bacterium ELA615]